MINWIKRYDRSIVSVATAVGVILATYLAMGARLNAVVEQTPCIQGIKAEFVLHKALQKQSDEFLKERLDEMNGKLDRILRK